MPLFTTADIAHACFEDYDETNAVCDECSYAQRRACATLYASYTVGGYQDDEEDEDAE